MDSKYNKVVSQDFNSSNSVKDVINKIRDSIIPTLAYQIKIYV